MGMGGNGNVESHSRTSLVCTVAKMYRSVSGAVVIRVTLVMVTLYTHTDTETESSDGKEQKISGSCSVRVLYKRRVSVRFCSGSSSVGLEFFTEVIRYGLAVIS